MSGYSVCVWREGDSQDRVEEQKIGYKEVKAFKGHIVRCTVHMDAEVLKNGDKSNDGRKNNDTDNISSMHKGE